MKSPVTSITDEQLAEIEALAIKAPETTGDLYLYANTMTPSLLFSLTARLLAAEADAKRYRRIRSHGLPDAAIINMDSYYGVLELAKDERLDAALDSMERKA
jgi:hypothetical protein